MKNVASDHAARKAALESKGVNTSGYTVPKGHTNSKVIGKDERHPANVKTAGTPGKLPHQTDHKGCK